MKYKKDEQQRRDVMSIEEERFFRSIVLLDNVDHKAAKRFVLTASSEKQLKLGNAINDFLQRYGHTLDGNPCGDIVPSERRKAKSALRDLMMSDGLMLEEKPIKVFVYNNWYRYQQSLIAAQRSADRLGHPVEHGYDMYLGWTSVDARDARAVAELGETTRIDNEERDGDDGLHGLLIQFQVRLEMADAYIDQATSEDKNELYGLFRRYQRLSGANLAIDTVRPAGEAKGRLFGYLFQQEMISLSFLNDQTAGKLHNTDGSLVFPDA